MVYAVAVRYSARRHPSSQEKLGWSARLPGEFAFLVSAATGRPVQPAFDFLQDTYIRGRTRPRFIGAENTIRAVVRDLSDFHDYLDSRGKLVEAVDEGELEEYLLTMVDNVSPTTGKRYSAATITRRKSSVCSFLKYCQEKGRLQNRFSVTTSKTPRGSTERIGAEIPVPATGPIDRLIRAVDPRVLREILDETGPAAVAVNEQGQIEFTGELCRARLMAEVCLQTGIRREECCQLQRDLVAQADIEGRSPLSFVAIPVRGKGGKTRNVPFPVWLLAALRQYVSVVRDPIVEDAISNGSMEQDHGRLFVLETKRKSVWGRRLLPGQFGLEFRVARERLVRRLAADPKAAIMLERVRRTRLCIHALRHTFALTTFIQRRTQGDADAAKYVQSVLGHSFRETTENMYLRSSHTYEAELSEAYELLLRGAIDARKAA